MVGGKYGDAGVECRSEISEIPLAVVAFEAQREDRGTAQQARVHRAVRLMAGLAALDRDRAVLEDERPALIGVAFDAGFFVALDLVHHARARSHAPGGIERAVRIVAVRALNDALVHAMLEGHRELRAN